MGDENDEETRVTLKTYKIFLKYCGGWSTLVLPLIVLILFMFCRIILDYTVGAWAVAKD